jgi:RNA polymerase sigma factor (sigma-70 family)
MPDANDMELLREYSRDGSETAFADLVRRHINLVYSVALRHVGITAHAEEITQAVFIILVRKAAGLREKTVLEGWLYETARLTALSFMRGERRRQLREQEAYMQSILNEPDTGDAVWNQLASLLDEAMARLGKTDRDAVILRFFNDKSVRDVATSLQVSEAAAQRRILRALEKMHRFFTKRGVNSTIAIIAGSIPAHSIQIAPAALAKTVTAVATTKGSIAAASTLTLVKGALKIMAWSKIKLATTICLGVVLAASISTVIVAQTKSVDTNTANIVATDDTPLITPHVSVGKVKAGMTEDEVIVALGQPDRQQGEVLIYDSRFGFSVVCSRQKIVGAVFCGDASGRPNSPIVKAFTARTREGIGMGSSKEALIKAFGPPTSRKPWSAGQEQLEYTPLGLTFTLQQDKVIHIIVNLRKTQ